MSGGRSEGLDGAVAIVTGGGTGIGRASALSLARLGMAVVLAGPGPKRVPGVVLPVDGGQVLDYR